MDGLALLDEAHAAGLTVKADGDRLVVCGPRRCAALAQSLLDHKPDVMAALAEWGDAAAAIAWFASWSPPDEPFELKPSVTVLDPRRWRQSIAADIAQGPFGPRARYGALQDDLKRLHGLFGTAKPRLETRPKSAKPATLESFVTNPA